MTSNVNDVLDSYYVLIQGSLTSTIYYIYPFGLKILDK
jgi:hypothetical protein